MTIARALAGDPDLLILDEPTSALDLRSEALLEETFSNLRGQLTLVVIAHRLSTISACDRLLVIESGRTEALGTPTEVEATSPFFREALARTRAGFLPESTQDADDDRRADRRRPRRGRVSRRRCPSPATGSGATSGGRTCTGRCGQRARLLRRRLRRDDLDDIRRLLRPPLPTGGARRGRQRRLRDRPLPARPSRTPSSTPSSRPRRPSSTSGPPTATTPGSGSTPSP